MGQCKAFDSRVQIHSGSCVQTNDSRHQKAAFDNEVMLIR